MIEWKYNKATLFVLPMLHLKADGLGLGGQLFKNCYIGVDIYPELDNHIFLHYKYSPRKDFLTLEAALMKRMQYVKDIHAGDDILYCFKVPDNYLEDFNNFKQGKYSSFNNLYKIQILRCFDLVHHDPLNDLDILNHVGHRMDYCNIIYPVINKLEVLKQVIEYNLSNYTKGNIYTTTEKSELKLSQVHLNNQELFDIPDLDEEIYKYNKVRYPKNKIQLNNNFENE